MLDTSLVAHRDLHRHHVAVAVTGPLATADHGAALQTACLPLPPSYGLIVDLSAVTFVTDTGLHSLKELARRARADGRSIAFVCSELMLRAELVLADLDLLAPVLQATEQAYPLVGFAA